MAKRGRPPKVTVEQLINGVDDYIAKADPPIVAEYALLNGITRGRLYQIADEHEELLYAIKKIIDSKEVMLEKKALNGKYNATMAIFSLKQLGWKDRQDVEDTEALTKLDEILKEAKDAAISQAK